jgi:hypothetical protein
MLSVTSWNMNQTTSSWSYLDELASGDGTHAFLLQEARRPAQAPGLMVTPTSTNPRPGRSFRTGSSARRSPPHRRYSSNQDSQRHS